MSADLLSFFLGGISSSPPRGATLIMAPRKLFISKPAEMRVFSSAKNTWDTLGANFHNISNIHTKLSSSEGVG